MKKILLNLLLITSVVTVFATPKAFAYVSQANMSQNQQQADLYAQQTDYLRQQTEYLKQQTEALRQQNEALKQSQAYNQGYMEGQRYYHREGYSPAVVMGGFGAGYVLGHVFGFGHCYSHHCHRCW